MNRSKRIWYYVCFMLVFLAAMYGLMCYYHQMQIEAQMTLKMLRLRIGLTLGSILIGMLYGLDTVVRESGKPGEWKYDWIRLTLMGLPTLLLSLNWAVMFYMGFILTPLAWISNNIINVLTNGAVTVFGGVLFGITVLTSLRKSGYNMFR